jgi:hypothetical protein
MNLLDIDIQNVHDAPDSLLESIHNGSYDVVIKRNFFSKEECRQLVNLYNNIRSDAFTVYDGYKAIPRPFDKIGATDHSIYEHEASIYTGTLNASLINEIFLKKMKSISPDYEFILNDGSGKISKSKTWSSFRELELNKGYFEIHCGRLFQDWNKEFFNFFSGKADIDNQLAFLIVLQRPETDCDLEIFDLKWDDVNVKIDKDNLKTKEGKLLPVVSIPSEKIILNEGDVLIFDEGNYWHLVPPFTGDMPRISFGGFMTRLYNSKQVFVWF